jgi:hypothetical protein
MGKAQSREQTKDAGKGGGETRQPVIEDVFVQKIAYKCGVTEEELEKKKEAYMDHLSGDPTLGFQVDMTNPNVVLSAENTLIEGRHD